MTGASVICAISFLREWQKGQRRISISKTRFINSAHVYFLLLRTALTAPDLVFRRRQCRVLSSGFGSGTTTARSAALGANTPKQVTRFCRGGRPGAQRTRGARFGWSGSSSMSCRGWEHPATLAPNSQGYLPPDGCWISSPSSRSAGWADGTVRVLAVDRAHEAEAQVVVPVRWRVPVAIRRAAVLGRIVPVAAAFHAVRPASRASTPPAQS